MSFRESAFINFNTGVVITPPMELSQAMGRPLTTPEMILRFKCRVDVWRFGPAVEMLKLMEAERPESSVWAHSAYGLLSMLLSYFEMVGKILNPESSQWKSAPKDFAVGFCDVYPDFLDKPDVVEKICDRTRNGMFHLGFTKHGTWVHHRPTQFPDDFMVVPEDGTNNYLLNPHHLTRTLVEHFPKLTDRLENPAPEFDSLRDKFRVFYLEFHIPRSD